PGSESRVVGFAMGKGAVGVVRNGANFGYAVDEPETAETVAVVDGVVGIGVGVVFPKAWEDSGVASFDDASDAGGGSGAVRCDARDAIVIDENVNVLLFFGAGAFPEARGMDEEFLLRLCGNEGEGYGDWRDGFAVTIDEFQLAVVEVENSGRIGAIGGSVGSLVVELDGGTAGMTVGIYGHGVEKIVHDEGHLFAVWRVD